MPAKTPRRKSPSVPFFFPDWLEVHEIANSVRLALDRFGRGRLLDVGCGEKPFKRFGRSVDEWIGLDVPDNPVADVHGYADQLPFADASFDTVLCTQVLEHVPDPAAVLHEFRRVLRDGGHVIVTAPQYWPLHEEPHDYYRYTPYGLRHLFEHAGLENVMMRSRGTGFRVAFQALNLSIFVAAEVLPLGRTRPVRALFIPLYALNNALAVVLDALTARPIDVMHHLVVGRKRDVASGGA
jgi:SAM-dependent methyltransferase